MNCARLEAKHEYFVAQIEELQSQHVTVPPFLAGYAAAAADALETLGCPKSASYASDGQSTK